MNNTSELLTSKTFAIGIDIGGTKTVFGLVDHRGNIRNRGILSTQQYPNFKEFVTAVYQMLRPSLEWVKQEGHTIKGIGIGAPNGNHFNGCIEYAPNLPWTDIVFVTNGFTEQFAMPSFLTNDANAAAIGEMYYGAAKGCKDFIVITLGTGVGSGIVCNGKLVYGHDGFAGELGHSTVIVDGRLHWSTGLKGSLESYCSATGVVITAKELLAKNPDTPSVLRNQTTIDSKMIASAALQQDKIALEVFQYTGEILGLALANFITFSSPEAIILFGGLCNAGDLLMLPTKASMEKNLIPIFKNKVKLLFSELKESDAAILGASSLVW